MKSSAREWGWTFKWFSARENGFNYDYHLSFKLDEIASGEIFYNYRREKRTTTEHAGISVFYRDFERGIFHTYFMLRARIGHAE